MLMARDLHVSYGSSLVLQGIDLKVKAGEMTAIMGRNGMGKTTLMKTIVGLLPTTSGEIRIGNESINGLKPHEIAARGVGYVPQGREIFGNLTVMENLRLGTLRFPRRKRQIPTQLFEYFPILRMRNNQRAAFLSGGEQQMLAMARALAGQPKLLLLDEPFEGIQPSIIEEIAVILRTINQETGITIVIVEQHVDMVLDIVDMCAILEKGRIVATYPVDTLRQDESLITQYLTV